MISVFLLGMCEKGLLVPRVQVPGQDKVPTGECLTALHTSHCRLQSAGFVAGFVAGCKLQVAILVANLCQAKPAWGISHVSHQAR